MAIPFALPGGPPPANLEEVARALDGEGSALELLLSFGTSKGGSAGHLAVAVRDPLATEALVYSANFYADRDPLHDAHYYNRELMVRVPQWEYLYGTESSLGPKASFGLDFGEIYKRTVVGVRVYGAPVDERRALAAYFARMNDDFHGFARDPQYHRGEVKYGYMDLNCAKTIGSAFRYGAGYDRVEIREAPRLAARKAKAALNANTPSEMAMQLMRELAARGYRMDVILYRKCLESPYVDPHDEEAAAFKSLPNRFPSAISLDFRNDERHYEDYDNLYAMYLMRNMLRTVVTVDAATHKLSVTTRDAAPYPEAAMRAAADAESDSRNFLRRLLFPARGQRIDAPTH